MARKPRPLTRDESTFRDDRLLLVACDDSYAPKQYFDFFRMTRVRVHVVPSEEGRCAALDVLARLKEFEYEEGDELWLLLDTDHYVKGSHLQSFTEALRRAKQAGIQVALSRPCFEFWLLLHHDEPRSSATLNTAAKVIKALRDKIGKYDKARLRSADFPSGLVSVACLRAEKIDASVGGGEIPDGTTTRVYRLWKSIMKFGAPPSPTSKVSI